MEAFMFKNNIVSTIDSYLEEPEKLTYIGQTFHDYMNEEFLKDKKVLVEKNNRVLFKDKDELYLIDRENKKLIHFSTPDKRVTEFTLKDNELVSVNVGIFDSVDETHFKTSHTLEYNYYGETMIVANMSEIQDIMKPIIINVQFSYYINEVGHPIIDMREPVMFKNVKSSFKEYFTKKRINMQKLAVIDDDRMFLSLEHTDEHTRLNMIFETESKMFISAVLSDINDDSTVLFSMDTVEPYSNLFSFIDSLLDDKNEITKLNYKI